MEEDLLDCCSVVEVPGGGSLEVFPLFFGCLSRTFGISIVFFHVKKTLNPPTFAVSWKVG